jgi:hypothetical protein
VIDDMLDRRDRILVERVQIERGLLELGPTWGGPAAPSTNSTGSSRNPRLTAGRAAPDLAAGGPSLRSGAISSIRCSGNRIESMERYVRSFYSGIDVGVRRRLEAR